MANKQIGKPQFVSKLRPPSAVKRPREQAFTKGVPPNCEVCIDDNDAVQHENSVGFNFWGLFMIWGNKVLLEKSCNRK